MLNLIQHVLPFKELDDIDGRALAMSFEEWDRPSRQVQVWCVSALTSLLYIIFTFIDKSWVPSEIEVLMTLLHLCIVVPLLLLTGILAFKKVYYQLMMRVLAIFPIISMSCHAYLASNISQNSQFMAEAYLGILWIFIISGLTFQYAIVSALLCVVILLTSAYFYIADLDVFILYTFWIFCSFSFGFIASLVLDRSRKMIFSNQQSLQLLAVTDPLTGVFNRNQMSLVLAKEIQRCTRCKTSFGLLMLDIDHFKNINDTFGHDKGDIVLKGIALLLSNSIRENDTLIRWGGEEFVVIVLGMERAGIKAFAEKLRSQIQTAQFDNIELTASIGATLFSNTDTKDTILIRADKALYEAKRAGRNQVMFRD